MERETGIEPATNSLEGCDSTTELLPPSYPSLLLSAQCSHSQSTALPPPSSKPAAAYSGLLASTAWRMELAKGFEPLTL